MKKWHSIEVAPKDREILVYCPPSEGLPELFSITKWHPHAGYFVCPIRSATHWTEHPGRPAQFDRLLNALKHLEYWAVVEDCGSVGGLVTHDVIYNEPAAIDYYESIDGPNTECLHLVHLKGAKMVEVNDETD